MNSTDWPEFALDAVEAVVVGKALDVRLDSFPLRLQNTSIDPCRFAAVMRFVGAALEGRGLAVEGVLAPCVQDAFEMLARHRLSISISGIDGEGDDFAAVVLTDSGRSLEIFQLGPARQVNFMNFTHQKLREILEWLLPQNPPADGPAFTVSGVRYRSSTAVAESFGNGVRSVGDRTNGALSGLAAALSAPRTGSGRIEIVCNGQAGVKMRSARFGWLCSEGGQYLVRMTGGIARYGPAGYIDILNFIEREIDRMC
jgi:hypothetical protein